MRSRRSQNNEKWRVDDDTRASADYYDLEIKSGGLDDDCPDDFRFSACQVCTGILLWLAAVALGLIACMNACKRAGDPCGDTYGEGSSFTSAYTSSVSFTPRSHCCASPL